MTSRPSFAPARALLCVLAVLQAPLALSFLPGYSHRQSTAFVARQSEPKSTSLFSSVDSDSTEPGLRRVPVALEGLPIPYVDIPGNSYIECYADSIAKIGGVEYTIGVPCDYAVALWFNNNDNQLVPNDLDDPIMEGIFNISEGIVAEGKLGVVGRFMHLADSDQFARRITHPFHYLLCRVW